MNRKEFMNRLEELLSDLPEEEVSGVLDYYNDYLDEAGPDAEAEILAQLGSPEKIARVIRAGMEDSDKSSGEFTEHGYEDRRFDEERDIPDILHGVPALKPGSRKRNEEKRTEKSDAKEDKQEYYYYGGQDDSDSTWSKKTQSTSRWSRPEPDGSRQTGANRDSGSKMSRGTKILLIIILCVFAIPIGFPVVAGLLAALAAILIGIAGILCSAGIVGAALIVAGLSMAFVGFVKLVIMPGAGLLISGLGFMVAAVGLVLFSFFVWLCGRVFPGLVRWIVNLCRKPFQRGGRAA